MDMIPSISDSELEIMKIIWRDKQTTTNKIIEELADEVEWKPNTVKTLVNRLLNKNAIGFDKAGKEYYYYPLVMKEEYIEKESESFINKFFNGSINSMLLNFVKNQKISARDIEVLQDILNNNKEII
ncbi:BlaI/MecI/CopY family transcriptional regulator [Clostridium sp. JN-9]|nr:BlaI/MecI/CopY family transcriptional regulator [Clostridium sp. JN-9]